MSWSGGDWMCGACQHINFKKRDSCQTCGYPKFGGPDPTTYRYNWTETLAGDWYCTSMNCGAHNYASRSSCYRCGALKDGYSCRFGGNIDPCGGYASDCPPGWKTGDWICSSFRVSPATGEKMVSPKQLLGTIESALLGASSPTAAQRVELLHALRTSVISFQSLLSYPPPKPSDRSQLQSKSVRLPDSPPISLDDQDVHIALKLSDDLHLNEVDCVRLLVSANQEAVVLDQGLQDDILVDIQKYLEDLISSGLRQRLISLIKELNREEPSGLGGLQCERFIIDSRGSLVERQAVVSRERLILGHCLVLSILVVRTSPKDIKDIFSVLKDNASEVSESNTIVKHQITFCLLFALVIAFVSDGLSTVPDKASVLSSNTSFKHEFHELVMAAGNDPIVEGFVGGVRLAWAVYLMLIQDGAVTRETISSGSSNELGYLSQCLEVIFSNNVFQFLLDKVLRTAAYQIKETKERSMSVLSTYRVVGSHDFAQDTNSSSLHGPMPFNSILDFVSDIYQKEPELLSGNDVLWTFANFAGEDHTNFHTLVAFLNMLSTLACSQEGASKVYELLQGKAFRSIGWSTLFECLTIYDEKFKQSLQTAGAMWPEIQEGDAKALVAYLNVLKKVVENGNPTERRTWFPDIEPLFKLLSYENVPPYLKGALRNAITAFIQVSPILKDSIWTYLEQYDLPVVVGPDIQNSPQSMGTQNQETQIGAKWDVTILQNVLVRSVRARQLVSLNEPAVNFTEWIPYSWVYDMRFELNEIEARREQYPSTISFLNLINALIAEESDLSDRGRRFIGIFRFIYDHVFGPFPQRAYADPCEKWQLVGACLKHFHMVLSMYGIKDEDYEGVVDESRLTATKESSPLQTQLPVLELLKDFMSGKTAFRNIMSILLPGVNSIIAERSSQLYGKLLENAVQLSLEIIILVFDKDLLLSDYWLPLYQLLIDNISRPAPNITHLLLKFDLDTPIERTVLQPKFYYSCLKVILDILEELLKPDVNALLHEFCFQRAWLLKLLAVELHAGDVSSSNHREACQTILSYLFSHGVNDVGGGQTMYPFLRHDTSQNAALGTVSKSKVFELLEIIQFRCPDSTSQLSDIVAGMKYDLSAEDILGNSGKDGVYYYSERGDRLIDLAAFHDKLWQKYNSAYSQASNIGNEVELNNVRETIQQLLRWGWKYNKNLEEQAAQLHMLTAWSQIVEDCSLKMAFILSQVALTCMAKLRDERFLFPGSLSSDNITCLDLIVVKQLSNGACLTILFKLIMAILRNESSEALRRRYFQYCQNVVDPDVPSTVLQFLLLNEQDNEYIDLPKDGGSLSLDSLQRACTFEAELALLLRISHKYGKSGAQVKNKIVREVIDFVKGHQSLFDQVLRLDIAEADELRMEQINLVVGILSKVWPYEESDGYGFVQGLFGMMRALFSHDSKIPSFAQSRVSPEPSDASSSYPTSVELQQPTLSLLNSLLSSVTTALERAAEEKSVLLNKIRDINELSRQEVDEIINMCVRQDTVSSSDNIQKRRYIAMVEMCRVVANRDQLIILLLPLSEHILNIILIHLQESSAALDSTLTKAITYGSKYDAQQDVSLLCGKLVPTLERLELLGEDKVGHNLKVFRRLATSAKELAIQKLI
ncbi:Nuclear pore complex protein [Vigna angularis]|uniref:Nuclear pore complex protein n=1 Tax=Phaseolus angularis TaxID=3914 RepID=A0A8T0KKN6_PHAAN|nr:Nuclear pore complex protein [Vigna angularis]